MRVTGKAVKEYYHRSQGEPLHIRIMHNEKQVWPADGWAAIPLNNMDGINHNFVVDVKPGDAIRFILDKGTSPDHDILAWMPRIVYTDASQVTEQPTVVRILCGASTPYEDKAGNTWSADTFFDGGQSIEVQTPIEGVLPTAEDTELYRHGRSGKEFTYSISVTSGLYSVRLKFAETKYDYFFQRPFNLDINGRQVLRNFDICQAARAPRKAHERVFRYIVPDKNGRIVLRFSSGWEPVMKSGDALVQAIELLPEAKPTIRIDCGADREFVDWNSMIWSADSAFTGGKAIRSDAAISQASPTLYDQELYRTARTGRKLAYGISVPPGLYTVHLKFAELWLTKSGDRPMDIEINGSTIRQNWDPATAAGQLNMAADIRIENIAPDQDGKIVIVVAATAENDAILQGIEVE